MGSSPGGKADLRAEPRPSSAGVDRGKGPSLCSGFRKQALRLLCASSLERSDMGSSSGGKADLRAEPPASGQSNLKHREIA